MRLRYSAQKCGGVLPSQHFIPRPCMMYVYVYVSDRDIHIQNSLPGSILDECKGTGSAILFRALSISLLRPMNLNLHCKYCRGVLDLEV